MAEVPTVEQLYEAGQKLTELKDDASKVSCENCLLLSDNIKVLIICQTPS